MELPYPFDTGRGIARSIDIRSPTGGVLADTRKHADSGSVYEAFLTYVAGSVQSIGLDSGEIEDRQAVKDAVRKCPWALAEYLATKSMLMSGASDEIDVPFKCPRCHSVWYGDDENPVRVSQFKVKESASLPEPHVVLDPPVEFKDARTGEVVESVSELTFRLPTIGDCIRASRVSRGNDTRLQYAAWAGSIVQVNGNAVSPSWIASYGTMLFEKMGVVGVRDVSRAMAEWGIDSSVEAYCPKCGKEYRQEVPTGSFFASALQES